jgi:hypothetical protein
MTASMRKAERRREHKRTAPRPTQPQLVIPRACGGSSTPGLLGWTQTPLEYWVARSSRAMTAVVVLSIRVGTRLGMSASMRRSKGPHNGAVIACDKRKAFAQGSTCDEATHSLFARRASLTHIDGQSRHENSFPRRDPPEFFQKCRALKSEGAGNAGCALHPRSRVQNG